MRIQEINYSVDLLQAILWQYNDAPNINQLMSQKQSWYDINQTQFWDDWYNDVFNLQTATNFGLSVWCIILNIPYLILDLDNLGPIWGFNEVPLINTNQNFNNGNFANLTNRPILVTEDQRILLQLRYYQLTSRGARPRTNEFLNTLFNNKLILIIKVF